MSDDEGPLIVQLMAEVMAEVRAIAKDDVNKEFGYKFRGIDSVMDAVGPALRTHGIVPTVHTESVTTSVVEVGRNKTRMAHALVSVLYRFHAPDGSVLESGPFPGEAMDSGDKSVSKAMSVAERTCYTQTLALSTGQPDPDTESYERSPAGDGPDLFEELRTATLELADPAAVIAWTKDERITRGTLTDELAEEWRTRIAEASQPPPPPDTDGKEDPF